MNENIRGNEIMYVKKIHLILMIFILAIGILSISTSANMYSLEAKTDKTITSMELSVNRIEQKLDLLLEMHTKVIPYRRIK